MKLIKLFLIKFWQNHINNKEIMFFYDLDTMDPKTFKVTQNLTMNYYYSLESIPNKVLEQLILLKGKDNLLSFLNKFFNRSGILWLAMLNEKLVGLRLTFKGGFNGFYSIPISLKDVTLVAAEVFPKFRRHGLYADMSYLLFTELKNMGVSRAYLKVHIKNNPMLRAVSKMNFQRMGIVHTIQLFNRYITIWDKKSVEICKKND